MFADNCIKQKNTYFKYTGCFLDYQDLTKSENRKINQYSGMIQCRKVFSYRVTPPQSTFKKSFGHCVLATVALF